MSRKRFGFQKIIYAMLRPSEIINRVAHDHRFAQMKRRYPIARTVRV
jgi:hypothetical protein